MFRRQAGKIRLTVGIVAVGVDGGKWGIGRYLKELLKEFPKTDQDLKFEVFVIPSEAKALLPESKIFLPIYTSELLRYPVINFIWFLTILPWLCWKRRFNVLFLPAANRRIPFWAPCPMVGTVHDLAPIRIKNKYGPLHQFYYTYLVPKFMHGLKCVLTPSEITKRDLTDLTRVDERRIRLIPHGVDRRSFYPQSNEACRARLHARFGVSDPDPYILYVSRIEHPGKNHTALIQAYEQVRLTHTLPYALVLVGSARERANEVIKTVRSSQFSKSIIFTGFVSEEHLADFYCGAELYVHPSLFEGFGLPVLEAMACGVAVACSDSASLPEIAGDAALLFDPSNEREIVSCISNLLMNPDTRSKLVRKGLERCKDFDWCKAARSTLGVLREQAETDLPRSGRVP
jgi:glycosyltransferase involved in cell wall biosynthesis